MYQVEKRIVSFVKNLFIAHSLWKMILSHFHCLAQLKSSDLPSVGVFCKGLDSYILHIEWSNLIWVHTACIKLKLICYKSQILYLGTTSADDFIFI